MKVELFILHIAAVRKLVFLWADGNAQVSKTPEVAEQCKKSCSTHCVSHAWSGYSLYPMCVCVCVCERVCAIFIKSFTAFTAPASALRSNAPGNTASCSDARARWGEFQLSIPIWASFSHPCTAYRQLKFCLQWSLDGLCKWVQFQVRFLPDKPDNSLLLLNQICVSISEQHSPPIS
jgi:hypothetical protein